MKLLIRSVKVVDSRSDFNGKTVDILIDGDRILKIAKSINEKVKEEIDFKGTCVSPGWIDMHSNFGDPGYETKEDLFSGMDAAVQGGFTSVVLMPNTIPPLHSKAEIAYIKNKSKGSPVDIFPLGTISKHREGKDLAEMYDMSLAGAVAFSDGSRPVSDAGLMSRALLYAKGINRFVYSFPEDQTIALNGKMNEGEVSTLLGVKGIPALAEELMVARDIYLSEYNDAAVHFTCITSAKSVELIKAAKKKGLKVTADVSANHLFFDDSALMDFDSNFKLRPPLRTPKDVKALKNGIKDGTIDAVCSQHSPEDIEHKNVEFETAGYGMIALQTTFAATNMSLNGIVETDTLIDLFTHNPRTILGLEPLSIAEGSIANLSFFNPALKWEFTEKEIRSKSKNSAYLARELQGKAIAVYNHQQFRKL